MAKTFKYNRFSIVAGTQIERVEFIQSLIAAGYKGDINAAWLEYSKTLPKVEAEKSKRRKSKEESS